MRVLIIEDDAITAMDLEFAAQDLGYLETAVVRDEAEALSTAKSFRPDLILTDVKLENGGSGVRAVEEILRLGNVAVVVITGLLPGGELVEDQSAFVVLGKPYSPGGLKEAIGRALAKPPAYGAQGFSPK